MEEIIRKCAEHELTKKINAMLSDTAFLDSLLKAERALALAEADVGMIPEEAAKAIAEKCELECVDFEQYPALYEKYMHPLVPLTKLLQKAVGGRNGEYVHYACTTADILQTAYQMTIKNVWDEIKLSLDRMDILLADMAVKYADTMMVGRTHNIQALPMTFGFKVAGWLAELRRNKERMEQAEQRIFVVQLCGAIGTLSSYGDRAFELQAKFAEHLGMGVPPEFCWQSSKDRMCEAFDIFNLISGLLGRIARQVYLLMMTEIDELREGRLDSYVGSSAMPHKINPVNSQHMRAVERQIRYRVSHMHEIVTSLDHERNMDGSNDQKAVCYEICRLIGEMAERGETLLLTLEVDEGNMLRNLNLNNGLILSESVMMELGKAVGRQYAHDLIMEIATKALSEHLSFRDLLLENKEVTEHLSAEKIDELLDPKNYLGYASYIAKEVAKNAK